jgi:hypothetical protein
MLLRRVTGEIKPVSCWRLACPSCLPRCAFVRSIAISDAAPERFCTFTRVGDTWEAVRSRMRHLASELRGHGRTFEWVWTVEHNPKGTGHHVHAWQRGGYLPQRELARLADTCGMGKVTDIRSWSTPDADAVGYGLKEAIGYGLKETRADDQGSAFLFANGGRLTHQSRGFFLGGVKSCERAALDRRADGLGSWEIVTKSALEWDRRAGEIAAHRPVVRGRARRLPLDGRL